MILSIRKKSRLVVTLLLFIFMQTYSVEVYALTSGPAQEEYASFEPVGTTDMVNLYSGDFTYNIPLLSVPGPNGGYPINLAYHSGIGMDQEASWVGLGWNVNVGAINRNLRGLPDDFNGDEVTHIQHMRKSWTVGLNLFQEGQELFGLGGSSGPLQLYYNNYKGVGYRVRANAFSGLSRAIGSATSGAVNLGISVSYDPHEGIGVGASLGVSAPFASDYSASLGVSGSWNSRQGLQGMTVSGSVNADYVNVESKDGSSTRRHELNTSIMSTGVTFNFSQGVPAVTMAMRNTMFTTDLKMGFTTKNLPGGGIFKTEFPLDWTGSYSESKVRNGTVISRAYGYMNSENASEKDLKDFSYTPIAYNRKLPDLSPSNVTNDVFSIAGQGTGGVFRGYRADIGIFHQRNTYSITEQHRVSLEAGAFVQTLTPPVPACPSNYQFGFGGLPPTIGIAEDKTGAWEDGLGVISSLKNFKNPADYDYVYDKEVKFYKDINDKPAILGNNSMYDVWKEEEPIKLEVHKQGVPAVSVEGISGGVDNAAPDFRERTTKTPRTRVINSLTRNQAARYGVTKNSSSSNNHKYYDTDGTTLLSKYTGTDHHAIHHTSEVSILEPDGMRYVYGLPAYNLSQEDASFSVEKDITGLGIPNPTVTTPAAPGYFEANSEWSKQPEYLNKTKLPPYAHCWMLTSVLSADYVDLTGDGLSEDDLGYWVDFKYKKTSSSYNWRAPYEESIYMPGTAQEFDDKGSYSKGVKELYYLAEVRTKTHVAIYETEDRNDAIGASSSNHNGGRPSSIAPSDKMQKLKRIKLYTIDEYNKTHPEPLKTVHFKYMEEADALCQGVPNHVNAGTGSPSGKLTLKQVHFTYGKSDKGVLSPYEFKYATNNPDYNLKNHDCWGNYQNNNINDYPYHEYPYTNQEVDSDYQAPWHLTTIELPTGGSLNIQYEQDDYAYVEDKKAMQLYDIAFTGDGTDFDTLTDFSQRGTGVASAHTSSLRNNEHYDANNNLINPDFEYRIYFPLKTPIPDLTNPNASAFYGTTVNSNVIAKWFKEHYIGDTKDLYFKSAVKLKDDPGRNDERVDFVAGYAELRTETALSHYGVDKSPSAATNEYDVGYITVQPTIINAFGGGKDKIHPIRDAAFQHIRFARPELVNGTQTPNDILSLFNVIPDVLSSLMGYKYYYKSEGYASEIFLDGFSQIRLLVPDGKKIGGGVRVKKLTISDNWTDMAGAAYQSSYYGQVYDYTTIEDGVAISSGVAYEPFAGKEQNPLVTPVRYKHSNPMQNPNNLFLENPVLMRHYPGASVGYRKVTVKSLSSVDDDNKENRIPYTEYEFYSPKEFPIEVKETDPDKVGPKYKIGLFPGIYTAFKRTEAMSQGYTIVFNDMAGKMKSVKQKTYTDVTDKYEGEVISSQKYEYYTQNSAPNKLDNEVDVFTGEGVYEKAKLGIDYDIQIQMNEQNQSSDNFAMDLNLVGGVLPYCIPIPTVTTGGFSSTGSSLKTAVVLKLISKSGILKSTTVTNQNSTITTENLVFDKMTGEPLLTRTKNEFKDDIYAYNQKAYWHYDGMAEAFKNTGTVIEQNYAYNSGFGGYTITIPTGVGVSEFPLVEGDEVFLEHTENSILIGVQATVFSVAGSGLSRQVKFSNQNGEIVEIDPIEKITIIRSGRRNLLTAPAGAIAAMDLNYQPNAAVTDEHTLTIDNTSKILNASAMTYRDYWPTDKNCERVEYCSETKCISFEVAKGEINAGNIVSKIDDGSIIMALNGEPLTSSDIIVGNDCPPDTKVVALCTGVTDPDFTVEYELNGVNTVVPHVVRQGTRCGDVNTGEAIIPCASGQNDNDRINGSHVIKVDGQVWGTDITFAKANDRCEYGYGRWNLAVPSGSNGGSHVVSDYNCMIGGFAVHISKIEAGYSSNSVFTNPWGLIPPSSNPNAGPITPLLEHLDVVTGLTNGSWQQVAGHARAYVPIGKARNMKAFDHFHLGTYNQNNILQPFCYPSYLPAPKSPKMEYNFDYEPAAFHGFVVRQLAPGPHVITYETSGGNVIGPVHNVNIDSNAAIPIIEMDVELPTGTTVNVILRDPTGTIINTITNVVVPSASTHGVQITIPNLSVGNNQLDVAYNNTEVSYNLICDADDAQRSVLQCADGNASPNPDLPFAFYQKGAKGRWRPWASYTYVSDRYYGDASTPNPSIREKGVFEDYTPFSWVTTNSENWQWASRSNQYMAEGYEVESVDALGNYSAALYDYNDNLAVAVAKNARYHEIMFDGFENYPKACNTHAYLTDGQDAVNTQHHTGEWSYRVASNSIKDFESITLNGIDEVACAEKLEELYPQLYDKNHILDFLREGKETPSMKIPKIMRTATASLDPSHVEVMPKECGCLGKFAPKTGKKYHLSAWLKRDLAVHDVVTYESVYIAVSFRDASGVLLAGTATLLPQDGMVEKWQRVSGDFDVPADAAKMYLSIHNTSTAADGAIFLDDLRMMPFESSMATYVYDESTLRNTATLDDNNFATFYTYDEEGKLIKTKKETTEGIKTINEGRQHVRGPL